MQKREVGCNSRAVPAAVSSRTEGPSATNCLPPLAFCREGVDGRE